MESAPVLESTPAPSLPGMEVPGMAVPALTNDEARRIEQALLEGYHIAPLQQMEVGGRALADLAARMVDTPLADAAFVVLAGKGTHGGTALAAARHLLSRGAWVQVVGTHPTEQYKEGAAQQLATLDAMGAPLVWSPEGYAIPSLPDADLVIDALVAPGIKGDPRGRVRELMLQANGGRAAVLSLEAPTGIDTDDGQLYQPHIRAAATLSLGLPRRGLLVAPARSACGRLFVADAAWPLALYAEVGIEPPLLFQDRTLIELQVTDGFAHVANAPARMD